MSEILTKDIFCNAPIDSISIKVESALECSQGYIEYNVSVSLENYEYEIGRRYNQFKDFDKTLKYHFRDISIPNLPSKFALVHKIEQRKRGFHIYMSGLVQLLKMMNIDQKALLTRLIAEFLQLEGTQLLTEKRLSNSSKVGLAETLFKNSAVGLFRGWVEMKLSENWAKFYASIQGDCIYLFENSNTNSFTYAISLFLGSVQAAKSGVLELHHDHENFPILFKSSAEEFKKALVIACSSNTDSPLSQFKKNCAGRISVTIHSGHNLCVPKPAKSIVKPHIFVSIDLDCFNFSTTVVPQEKDIRWEQTFVMPVFNVFFDLKISVGYVTSEGWVKQHAKKEVLEEFRVPLTDVNQEPYNMGTIVMYLDKARTEKKLKNEGVANVVVTIQQQNSFLSNFVPPAMHYIEDTQLPEQASMHDLKIAFKRLKRVRILYLKMLKTIYHTFFWIYPKFSKLVMIIYCVLVLFLPSQCFFPLFFLSILVFLLLMNPKNKKLLKTVKCYFFSETKHVIPYPRVRTIKESLHIKKCNINILKEKAQEGVIKRWKKFKEDAVELQNYLTFLACYGEKIRLLFLWEDPQKSLYFAMGILLFIMFLILIPFRFILFAGGLYKFYKGYKYTKKRILQNRKLCEEVLSNLFSQYFSDSFVRVQSNEFWKKEILENVAIQKKIAEGIRMRLGLDVDVEMFETCKSPLELCGYLSSAAIMLRHKDNKGEHLYDIHMDRNNNLLLGFLTNVPSEFYRLEHPRLTSVESYY